MKDFKKELKVFNAKAKAIVNRIAKERDALRDLIGEYQDVLETADEASVYLENAIDKISELL